MNSTETEVDLVQEAILAFNASDRERLETVLAKDVQFTETPGEVALEGREDVLHYIFGVYRTAFPNLHARIIDALRASHKAGIEVLWTGTYQGDLVTPFGTFAPTGNHFAITTFLMIKCKDGKISSIDHYYDVATTMRQLGCLPNTRVLPPTLTRFRSSRRKVAGPATWGNRPTLSRSVRNQASTCYERSRRNLTWFRTLIEVGRPLRVAVMLKETGNLGRGNPPYRE